MLLTSCVMPWRRQATEAESPQGLDAVQAPNPACTASDSVRWAEARQGFAAPLRALDPNGIGGMPAKRRRLRQRQGPAVGQNAHLGEMGLEAGGEPGVGRS